MSPQLALLLCYGFIAWLFWKDMKWRNAGSWTLLIPGVLLAIQGSRPVSYWFGGQAGESSVEANPINTLVYALLIGAAMVVLLKSDLDWGTFIRHNKALCLVYIYLALSALWSEMPLISSKRLIKDFVCVLMALVFLTQTNPAETVRMVFVRVSYLIFPLSVICIRYFPEIGRGFTRAGEPMFTGLTTQKNSLGEVVFVFSLMVLWDLIEISKEEIRPGEKVQMLIRLGMLLMGFWLLRTSDSQTSLLCFLFGGLVFLVSQRLVHMRHGKRILVACLATVICLAVLDKTFGLSEVVIKALGRNPTLTGRTDIWKLVLEQQTDPLLGGGFYTFWDSSKGKAVINSFMQINEAHNGYLEMYLDGGLVGDFLLILLILTARGRVIARLFTGDPFGKIGLAIWVTAIIYNLSESSFFRLDPLWFVFLLVMINYPPRLHQMATDEQSV